MNEHRIRQLAEAIIIAERHGAYDPQTTFRYNLNPYPETSTPIKTFDRNLPIEERIRIAARDHQTKAGTAGWAVLLWNEQDDTNRIRQLGQINGNDWMHRNAAFRKAAQILGITPEDACQLFQTTEAATADGATTAAVLRHLADTGAVNWNIAEPPAASDRPRRPSAAQLRRLRLTEAKSRQALDDFLNAHPRLKRHMAEHYRPPGT